MTNYTDYLNYILWQFRLSVIWICVSVIGCILFPQHWIVFLIQWLSLIIMIILSTAEKFLTIKERKYLIKIEIWLFYIFGISGFTSIAVIYPSFGIIKNAIICLYLIFSLTLVLLIEKRRTYEDNASQ